MTKPDQRTLDFMSLTQKQSERNSANGFRTLLQRLQSNCSNCSAPLLILYLLLSNCSAPLLALYLLLALKGLVTAVSH